MLVLPFWHWICKPLWVRWRASDEKGKQRVANILRAGPVVAGVVIVIGALITGVPFAIRLH
ncbi:MAG: hypothetical protein U5K37_03305 [Natrialbaceae archaeon]|nr:hypothetical protein [Natrialbaceae archaeon]